MSCLGLHEHTLDYKGRVIVPAVFRELLAEGFTVALNSDWSALAIYPKLKWGRIWERLERIRDTDKKGMAYKRLILANSATVESLDSQGRFIIQRVLRDRAGITSPTNRVIIIGMGDYLEIWDEEKYIKREADYLAGMDELVDYIDKLEIQD